MRALALLISLPLALISLASLHAQDVRTGAGAFGTWERDAPGVSRHIRPTDLPPPTHHDNDPEEPDFKRMPKVVEAPQGKMPDVPKGFAVQVFAKGLKQPRVIRIAPNGDIFVAESASGAAATRAADLGLPRRRGQRRNGDSRSLRREPGAALRHRVPSAERPAACLCGRCEPGRSLPVPQRRAQGEWAGRSHHPEHPHVAALDARPGSLPGRQAPLRLDRLGFQCCRQNAEEDPGGNSGL